MPRTENWLLFIFTAWGALYGAAGMFRAPCVQRVCLYSITVWGASVELLGSRVISKYVGLDAAHPKRQTPDACTRLREQPLAQKCAHNHC